jgi:GntR family transcriptional repressor for pyruvate dehydrogenase complex
MARAPKAPSSATAQPRRAKRRASISKIAKIKIADGIIESLRRDIATGRLIHGNKMPSERELAGSFGVSQPTVREVLRALEALGLVDVVHGSGTYVSGRGRSGLASALLTLLQIQEVGLLEVQSVRKLLGLESIKLAALTATEEQIEAIGVATEAMEQIGELDDVGEMFECTLNYYKSMSAAANSPLIYALEIFLATLMTRLQVGVIHTRQLSFWRKRFSSLQNERRAIYEAIRAHQPEKALAAAIPYFATMQAAFERDPALNRIRLSDPNLLEPMSNMVQEFRRTPHN